MKKTLTLIAAGAIVASAVAPAFAGSRAAPIIEEAPVVVVENAPGSSLNAGTAALLLLLLLGAGIAASSSSST